MHVLNNVNTSYDSDYFGKLKSLQGSSLKGDLVGLSEDSYSSFDMNANLFDGVVCVALIMFGLDNGYSLFLQRIADTLNANRSEYNRLSNALEGLNSAVDKLEDLAIDHAGEVKYLDPTTGIKSYTQRIFKPLSYENWLKESWDVTEVKTWEPNSHGQLNDIYYSAILGYFRLNVTTKYGDYPTRETTVSGSQSNREWTHLGGNTIFKKVYDNYANRTLQYADWLNAILYVWHGNFRTADKKFWSPYNPDDRGQVFLRINTTVTPNVREYYTLTPSPNAKWTTMPGYPEHQKSNYSWKFLGTDEIFKNRLKNILWSSLVLPNTPFILSDNELQSIVDTIKILQPSSNITVDSLKTIKGALPLSKLRKIAGDAQQRMTYMNTINVQQASLIKAAENNYQIITQLAANALSSFKASLGFIAQHL